MKSRSSQVETKIGLHRLFTARAYSVIVFGALFCTLAVKFFHSWRNYLVNEYFSWILADIAVLLGIEIVLAVACFVWPRKFVFRTATVIAAIVCTWSVMNAGWLIRTGRQILPSVLLSLVRDPLSALTMIGVNLIEMPKAAVILLVPSAIALAFFFFILARPKMLDYNRKRFVKRVIISVIVIFICLFAYGAVIERGSGHTMSGELRYNCHLKAVTSLFFPGSHSLVRADFANARREIPLIDEVQVAVSPRYGTINHNVIIVVLEGIQYKYTSLADEQSSLTPHLLTLAKQGVQFANCRSALTHTTKALFAIGTGRFPSASQDLAEAVPTPKPYFGVAAILKQKLNFRTAFFQSAEGRFECAPGLVYNLGFDKFWAREDLDDPNSFLGYFSADEFSMLEPITEWIKSGENPFCLMIMCSVTHDPYEVPEWYAEPAKEPIERYQQTISYTDKFIAALDEELAKLNLVDKTIFCVIGDHGEGFGEHGALCHERIAFDEVLRIPWVLRAPSLVEPARKVMEAVSSVDLAPTVLTLFGFDTNSVSFDGIDALGHIPGDRKVYFAGWMEQGPAGFVKGNRKFIYDPMDKKVAVYDISADPFELFRLSLSEQQAEKLADEIIAWRKDSIFRLDQKRTGKKMLFDTWLCRWRDRVVSARYQPEARK